MHSLLPRESDVSPVQMWLLLVLSEGPNYGYNVIQRLDEMFAGYWRPKAGTIYPALEKLSEKGLIEGRVEHRDDAPDRKYYSITERGEEALRRGMDRWSRLMEHIEVYGERHRAIRKFRARMRREEASHMLRRLGDAIKKGTFDVSEAIPSLEPEIINLIEPLEMKFLYAYVEDGLEIEIEIEWSKKGS